MTDNPLAWLDESIQAFEQATGKKVVRIVMGTDAYERVQLYLDTPITYKLISIEPMERVGTSS